MCGWFMMKTTTTFAVNTALGGIVKRGIWQSDNHLRDKSSKAHQLLNHKFIPWFKPDFTILGGDYMDCEPLSHWIENKKKTLEGKRWNKHLEFASRELDHLQKHCKEIVYLEGNHEAWVNQYIDKHPEMEGLIEIPIKLELEKRGIKWFPENMPYKPHKDLFCIHGKFTNKYHAYKHLEAYGMRNVIYGHTHQPQTYSKSFFGKPHMAYGIGCLQDPKGAGYLKDPAGVSNDWVQQFAIIEIDKYFNVTPVNIVNNQFIYSGRVFKL